MRFRGRGGRIRAREGQSKPELRKQTSSHEGGTGGQVPGFRSRAKTHRGCKTKVKAQPLATGGE